MSRRRPVPRRPRLVALLTTGALVIGLAPAFAASSAGAEPPGSPPGGSVSSSPPGVSLVKVVVPDRAAVDRLTSLGFDVAEYTRPVDGGVEIHVVADDADTTAITAMGYRVGDAVTSPSDVARNRAERSATIAADASALAAADSLTVLRAEWFTSTDDQRFLSVEVKTDAPVATNILTVQWDSGPGTAMGSGGSATMSRFVDAGQYMYHRFNAPIPVTSAPSKVTISSTVGGSVTTDVSEWLGTPRKAPSPHYVSDFVDHYMDPTEIYGRFASLAKEFPSLTQLVDLPNKTNGYRRAAQATFGTAAASTLYVTSKAWGHEGGNDLSVALVNPGTASSALGVAVAGSAITVTLATSSSGAVTSSAAQVVAALNASPASSALLTASTYRGNGGAGVVAAAASTRLSDNLNAPASVSREPFQVQALRIGKARDGSRTGVFLYCQEHAREWVTPLVCVETAERLLRNYQKDPTTRKLVDKLDIFIVPSINPDGAHYSFYDFASQRKNMANHCGPNDSDPARRTSWGVDINRNFSVGSVFDGFTGASATNCLSGTFAGPAELSEPEARNEVWLVKQFPNIKFAMNTHSYGGYFMWPPGAYKAAGRELLPPVELGTEEFFWAASDHILSAVKQWRGTAIWPGQTGPVTDVLYSAAGNSADELWYNHGIIGWDFEVGADVWNPTAKRFEAVGFQPPFAEGHEEAMEFAGGQIGILEVALAHESDSKPPSSTLSVEKQQPGSTSFTFTTSEPATVYYTLDGSRPTLASPKLAPAGLREGAGSVTVTDRTEVRWFSVDIAGNTESRYRPDGNGQNYRRQVVTVQ
ncbi:MAG TPA: M14 family metallopeptidase [Humibacillus xanthopallidus]|nr:M14 family metallopeptidase [Humibacillus xanthopallidus]